MLRISLLYEAFFLTLTQPQIKVCAYRICQIESAAGRGRIIFIALETLSAFAGSQTRAAFQQA